MSIPLPIAATSHASLLETELRKFVRGQVRFRTIDRKLYATDASIYQVDPTGVVIPADIDDVIATARYCGDRRIPLLPRGGGTSLAGQCTNTSVVLDLSAACRSVLSIDAAARIAHVEAGISIDELNRQVIAGGAKLFFAPDPATVAQAAIGGCINNNAAGSRSIRYGRTSENVASLDVLLMTGERVSLEAGAGRRDPVARRLAQETAAVVSRYAEEIRARFPKTVRRNAGYGLDMILTQLDRGVLVDDLDLTGLICGSEGTLAIVLTAKLKLQPIPVARALGVATFASLEEAIAVVAPLVKSGATAVELLDDVVLDAARNNVVTKPAVDVLPTLDGREPRAVLYVEYSAERSPDELMEGLAEFERIAREARAAAEIFREPAAMNSAWALRKSGEALLHGISATRKPHTFVEDNAVPLENLPRFVAEFKKIVTKHGTRAAYWAHASVGLLHIRPLIDLHDPQDRARMMAIAMEVADLARDCGGVMSGEHGDGRIRGPLLQRFFGTPLMNAFREIKKVFDPFELLNRDDIVNPGSIEAMVENLRIAPTEAGREVTVPTNVETFFNYDDQHGFGGAVEMCNGAGFCRKTAVGTMCPSYRATLDEQHSTRGRGNALRLAITGQLAKDDGKPKWDDAGVIETLDLCLSCKACKTECPSNVDISRLKAEYTAQRYRHLGAPLAARLFGHVRTLNRLAAIAPSLANAINRFGPVRSMLNRMMNLAPQRSIPTFGKSLYRSFHARRAKPRMAEAPVVILYADCFVAYNEPHIGLAAIDVLESLGYEVRLPKVGCCGRSMISTGLLGDAIESADETLSQLSAAADDPRVKAIVVCEPSCLSAIKDDWMELKLRTSIETRQTIRAMAYLVEDFVERFWNDHPIKAEWKPTDANVVLHGHCHQKALWGDGTSSAILKRIAGDKLSVLPSGCCGMAGSFGYVAEHYDVSMKIGELSVFPPIRGNESAIVVAPGTSCRHQIKDGTGRRALHPIEYVAQQLL